MKYLLIFLASAFVAVIIPAVKAAIPSYIHVCKRNDPDINSCVRNSMDLLKGRLKNGIPELEVPSLDPLYFEEVELELGTGLKTLITNLEMKGLEYIEFSHVDVNTLKNIFSFDITLEKFIAHGKYEVDASLAGIPLKGKGPLYFSAQHVTGRGVLHGKTVSRGGKTLIYFSSADLKLDMKDYEIKLENLFPEEPKIGEVTNKLLNEQKEEVKQSLVPGVERAVIDKILLVANNVCKHFDYDELFPPK